MKTTGEMIAGLASGRRGSERAQWQDVDPESRRRLRWWGLSIVLVSALFSVPLMRLVQHAFQHDEHSHIPLIPVVSAYLLLTMRGRRVAADGGGAGGALLLGTVGVAALGAGLGLRATLSVNDYLSLMTLAYVSVVLASGFVFLGMRWMRAAAFPLGFLVFMIPLPEAAVYWLERGSVLASAEVSAWLLIVTGTPMLREGTILALPGIVLEVAQECSGIRSSWVLLITSVLASNLFLQGTWRRVFLVAFVIPLGIIRNGFRILVIALLAVHVGPHMVHSAIHTRGGPIFFALSLVPFFLLLIWLRRGDRKVRT
jgi:exosortase C (VPDSG-CTERM-specific)